MPDFWPLASRHASVADNVILPQVVTPSVMVPGTAISTLVHPAGWSANSVSPTVGPTCHGNTGRTCTPIVPRGKTNAYTVFCAQTAFSIRSIARSTREVR